MRFPRASGVLLHPTSLPGRSRRRRPGPEAHEFVDFLAATGQRWWQMLPLGPTGYGNSPYQSHSSFAGNPLLIDLDDLVERGWLAAEPAWTRPASFPEIKSISTPWRCSRRACCGWLTHDARRGEDQRVYRTSSPRITFGWTIMLSIRLSRTCMAGLPWYQWEPELVAREPSVPCTVARAIRRRNRYHSFVQYAFETQWQALRAACRTHGIMLIGDRADLRGARQCRRLGPPRSF